MSDEPIDPSLVAIFRDVFKREVRLTAALTAADVPGWDSFKQVEIILAVEAAYGLTFHARELDGIRNVGDLCNVVKAKQAVG